MPHRLFDIIDLVWLKIFGIDARHLVCTFTGKKDTAALE